MKLKLSEFLAECRKLPAEPVAGVACRLAFPEADHQFTRTLKPTRPIFNMIEFEWDGTAWQVSQDTPITFVP